MGWLYRIEYELSQQLTREQQDRMSEILNLPWTPPLGYTGKVEQVSGPDLVACPHPPHVVGAEYYGCECWQ